MNDKKNSKNGKTRKSMLKTFQKLPKNIKTCKKQQINDKKNSQNAKNQKRSKNMYK